MYTQISTVDPYNLTELAAYIYSADPALLYLLFLLIGLTTGLLMRPKDETKVIGSLLCGIIGAFTFGFLCILTVGHFYGAIGALIASFIGASIFILFRNGWFFARWH